MMLEDAVQTKDGNLALRKGGADAACLRQAVLDATRAEHLEGLDQNDLAGERLQRDRLGRV